MYSISDLRQALTRLHHLFSRGIWQSEALNDRSARGKCYAVLRIVSMTWTGVVENSLASRAGALSYSSMLGIGPLVALVVLFSGMVLQRTDPDFAINQLNRALVFIVPQLKQLEQLDRPPAGQPPGPAAQPEAGQPAAAGEGQSAAEIAVNPKLVGFLRNIIEGSQSKAIGLVGALALIVIVIQLFSSIENAFNDIWGVRRGRNWMLRIVFYWTTVTLGALLAFASITLLSAATFVNTIESLPLGAEIRQLFRWAGPLISLVVLTSLLTVFYRFIPNTSVGWWPALTGAVVAVLALWGNNLLAFLYLSNVVRSQSLYGPLAVLIILMLGLYIFWLFLLIGGQVTYAVQNVNYRGSRVAWIDLNHFAREGLALLVLALIGRRFRACRPPLTVPAIAESVKIPAQILNACLGRLIALGFVSRIPPDEHQGAQDYGFQPACPLDRMRLADFKEQFEGAGEGPSRELLGTLDPIVRDFHQRLQQAAAAALGDETLENLIARLPAESLAPRAQPAASPA